MSVEKPSLDDLRIDRNARPERGSRKWIWILLLLIALLVAALVFKRPGAPLVRTAAVRELTGNSASGIRTLLNASGYVTARRQATVSSKVTGKVVEVLIEEGMRVEAGQVLARLDNVNVSASLQLADAQANAARVGMNETQVRFDEAERELDRVTRLAGNKIATQSDLDRAESEVKSLKARLQKQAADVTVAEREVEVWKQQAEDTIVRAPFAGIVTKKNAQPGEMISPISAGGGFTRTGICTIVDMTSLEIEVDVNESFIGRVETGQRVEAALDSYSDWKIPCKVIAIIPAADRQKATVRVRVGFEKLDPRILPDMGVKVAFQGSESAAPLSKSGRTLVVPKAAIRQANGRSVVFIVKNGTVERRAITPGSPAGEDITVAAGLSVDERVVVEGPAEITDGQRVKEKKP